MPARRVPRRSRLATAFLVPLLLLPIHPRAGRAQAVDTTGLREKVSACEKVGPKAACHRHMLAWNRTLAKVADDTAAMLWLGRARETGVDAPVDSAKAQRWYLDAAAWGTSTSFAPMGLWNERHPIPPSTTIDSSAALRAFRNGAQAGDPLALEKLGEYRLLGLAGTSPDSAVADSLFKLALAPYMSDMSGKGRPVVQGLTDSTSVLGCYVCRDVEAYDHLFATGLYHFGRTLQAKARNFAFLSPKVRGQIQRMVQTGQASGALGIEDDGSTSVAAASERPVGAAAQPSAEATATVGEAELAAGPKPDCTVLGAAKWKAWRAGRLGSPFYFDCLPDGRIAWVDSVRWMRHRKGGWPAFVDSLKHPADHGDSLAAYLLSRYYASQGNYDGETADKARKWRRRAMKEGLAVAIWDISGGTDFGTDFGPGYGSQLDPGITKKDWPAFQRLVDDSFPVALVDEAGLLLTVAKWPNDMKGWRKELGPVASLLDGCDAGCTANHWANRALALLRRASQDGLGVAATLVVRTVETPHARGHKVLKNMSADSLRWWMTRAAHLGDGQAAYELAEAYRTGHAPASEVDLRKAAALYRLAADSNWVMSEGPYPYDRAAALALGDLCLTTPALGCQDSVEADYEKAAGVPPGGDPDAAERAPSRWAYFSAPSTTAYEELGSLAEAGVGEPVDSARALSWYLAGARDGGARTAWLAAERLETGVDGVPADTTRAEALYAQAARSGLTEAVLREDLRKVRGVGRDSILYATLWDFRGRTDLSPGRNKYDRALLYESAGLLAAAGDNYGDLLDDPEVGRAAGARLAALERDPTYQRQVREANAEAEADIRASDAEARREAAASSEPTGIWADIINSLNNAMRWLPPEEDESDKEACNTAMMEWNNPNLIPPGGRASVIRTIHDDCR